MRTINEVKQSLEQENLMNQIAQDIAGTTVELLYDTVHWQITPLLTNDEEGDEYNAIHAEVMRRAIQIMHNDHVPLLTKS
tara:strand:- start:26 stop:265 length:240 start_codon:yes stop_codon:yes gene_type:complete